MKYVLAPTRDARTSGKLDLSRLVDGLSKVPGLSFISEKDKVKVNVIVDYSGTQEELIRDLNIDTKHYHLEEKQTYRPL
jgi:hypothetical protein